MTAQPVEPPVTAPRKTLAPIDPDSPAGREAARALGELFDDVYDRLRREGDPRADLFAP